MREWWIVNIGTGRGRKFFTGRPHTAVAEYMKSVTIPAGGHLDIQIQDRGPHKHDYRPQLETAKVSKRYKPDTGGREFEFSVSAWAHCSVCPSRKRGGVVIVDWHDCPDADTAETSMLFSSRPATDCPHYVEAALEAVGNEGGK